MRDCGNQRGGDTEGGRSRARPESGPGEAALPGLQFRGWHGWRGWPPPPGAVPEKHAAVRIGSGTATSHPGADICADPRNPRGLSFSPVTRCVVAAPSPFDQREGAPEAASHSMALSFPASVSARVLPPPASRARRGRLLPPPAIAPIPHRRRRSQYADDVCFPPHPAPPVDSPRLTARIGTRPAALQQAARPLFFLSAAARSPQQEEPRCHTSPAVDM